MKRISIKGIVTIMLLAGCAGSVNRQPTTESVPDPLAAMEGRWRNAESGDCATNWFEYSVAPNRRQYTTRRSNGPSNTATVLHTEPNRVYLFYDGETRRTPQGDLLLWWMIFEGPKQYRMRRIDWAQDSRTTFFWLKCD